jgi:hypothetical protein
MFSTCLFCHGALGANDAIEHFTVGKRLAFDGERGRLWAVCPRCARWNLAPIEERWEALEACEKAYRAATKRVSTDNIALARLKDGTDLVRIGQPLLPEYASWRYGDMVSDRRREFVRLQLGTTVLSAVGGGIASTAMMAGVEPTLAAPALVVSGVAAWWTRRKTRRPFVAALPDQSAVARRLAKHHVRARVSRADDGSWVIEEGPSAFGWPRPLGKDPSPIRLTGAAARAAMPPLLAAITPWGGNAVDVKQAADRFEATPDVEALFDTLVSRRWLGSDVYRGALVFSDAPSRLAFEMALHDEDERRALAGELGALYARWQDAERIARIADGELTRLPARG